MAVGWLHVCSGWGGDCSVSKSLSLSLFGAEKCFPSSLFSMFSGDFWMVFANLSSPLLLRGYFILTV